jgi:hypothetical protein
MKFDLLFEVWILIGIWLLGFLLLIVKKISFFIIDTKSIEL